MKKQLAALGAVVALGGGVTAFRGQFAAHEARQEVIADLEAERIEERTAKTFDAMFERAGVELRKRGHRDTADTLESQWKESYRPMLAPRGPFGDVGDRDPLFAWVDEAYKRIESVLGVEVMEATGLRDIWTMNRALGVTFKPHADAGWCRAQLTMHPGDTCLAEYGRAFTGTRWTYKTDKFATDYRHGGVAGISTKWAASIACTAATWGSGFLFCGVIGGAAQAFVEKFVAPKVAVRIWTKRNPA